MERLRKRQEEPKAGVLYKEQVTKMPGGYGIISWDSFNCLSPMETVIWLKLCETASKTKDNGIITVSEPWLNRNFGNRSDWKSAINAIFGLEDIGYVKCDVYSTSITVSINYDNLYKITDIIGRERGAGMRVASISSDILSLSPDSVKNAKLPVQYSENGGQFMKKILDELCGQ